MERPVFWNRLGSAGQVTDSAIGPDAEYLGGGSFAAGKYGGAYFAGADADARVLVPKAGVINAPAGAIEFWSKIDGFAGTIPWGAHPNFFTDQGTPSRAYWTGGFGFNGNNGIGGGGLTADVSGNGAATGSFGDWWSYDQVLTDDPNGWHHYALVWDAAGIANGGGHVVDIYLDGKLAVHQWDFADASDLDAVTVENSFLGLLDNWGNGGTAAIDNLKIWGFAKTDYSDRFYEGLTLVGEGRPDALTGTDVGDHLLGRGGNDTLTGLGGGDRLEGGDGNDRIFGGGGGDVVVAGAGNDLVHGDEGNDIIQGGAGCDTLCGGAGADAITDGSDSDALFGGAGADVFRFVLDGKMDRVADFDAGDTLDLSAWHTTYAALTISEGPHGAICVATDHDAVLLARQGLDVGDLTPDRFVFDLA